MINETIECILAHRTVRDFEDRLLSKEQIELLVHCAQAASTSSFVQAYSIIGVTDTDQKKKLSEITGNQASVAKNGHLFVFCADLHRHDVIGELEGKDVAVSLESTEKFMVSVIDATLAAQNTAIAAESMGLGICYVGGLRNDLKKVCELLKIPDKVLPLFAVAVGYPATINEQKPRLPLEHVYHEDCYEQDQAVYKEQLQQYNEEIQDYYAKRTGGERADTWTGQMAKMLAHPQRLYMHDFVEKQGLNKH
ncbi:nitroreductase [Trichococcus palustris]|jgi:FMN reductase (NADPH)|uniref:Nitroreductase n=1 Tax=Trichococcus palustris TaxID=140314 RepID=A0A143YFK2_9LACT|nr:oxygen-insensitive NADPH nitroreductase [Trichococcus palustris]CZQ89578.1 nitroreductase [Trichococcus palustris]SFL14655.1 FMN reductase (NADPH) [Trichococcus palustris]